MKRTWQVGLGALLLGATTVVATNALPALGHESDIDSEVEVAGGDEITPEPEGKAQPINSKEELVQLEARIDLYGSPSTYVCADLGDTSFTVVRSKAVPDDMARNPDAGPVNEAPDPCAGKDWVVGR